MAFRTLGPSCLLRHLPDPEVLIPAGGLLTCLGIGQSHLCQPLAALLGLESPILAQKPCTSDRWILGSPWPVPLWGELGSGSAGGSRAGGGRELTTVTMGGVRAQADVAGHQQAGEGLAQQTNCLDSRGVLSVRCRAPLILVPGKGQSRVSVP